MLRCRIQSAFNKGPKISKGPNDPKNSIAIKLESPKIKKETSVSVGIEYDCTSVAFFRSKTGPMKICRGWSQLLVGSEGCLCGKGFPEEARSPPGSPQSPKTPQGTLSKTPQGTLSKTPQGNLQKPPPRTSSEANMGSVYTWEMDPTITVVVFTCEQICKFFYL